MYTSVLEVVRYDSVHQESIVISGWADHADWYRNVRASSPLRVDTARQAYAPAVRMLPPQESYTELQGYIRRNPWAAPVVRRLFGLCFDASDAARKAQINALRGVGFRPSIPV